MTHNYLLFVVVLLTLGSCNPQKQQIETKTPFVAQKPPMGWNSYNCCGAAVCTWLILM